MLKTDQLYELNLPPFREIVLPTFKGFDDDNLSMNYLELNNISEFIKPEYLDILNLSWDTMLYFKKSNLTGSIHTDLPIDNYLANMNKTNFGINWITDGDGKIEFWDTDEVNAVGIAPGPINNPTINKVLRFMPKCPPSKSYSIQKDKVYLINASYPHRATGYANRKCYAMRPTIGLKNIPWDEVVNMFDNYIIR